jgi:hypothetical protein
MRARSVRPIAAERVRVEAKPLSWKDAALTMAELLAADVGRLFRRLPLERVRQLHEKLPAARS